MKTDAEAARRAFVTLRFAGDGLDPGEISAVLPVAPTRAHRKGGEFFAGLHAGKLRGRTGIWFLATDTLVQATSSQTTSPLWNSFSIPRLARKAGSESSARSWSAHTLAPTSLAFGAASAAPEVLLGLKSAIKSLNADIETDFSTDDDDRIG